MVDAVLTALKYSRAHHAKTFLLKHHACHSAGLGVEDGPIRKVFSILADARATLAAIEAIHAIAPN